MCSPRRRRWPEKTALRENLRDKLGDDVSMMHELDARMRSLDENCLTSLGDGLNAMLEGFLIVDVQSKTRPVEARPGQTLGSLGVTFNSMLDKAQSALGRYNTIREDLRAKLGDKSCLIDLDARLKSLDGNCLTDLGKAWRR